MKKRREFDNILDDCLERILAKGETVESCLLKYPEQAAELKPLLETSLAAKEATSIKPRPEFMERARYQFASAIREVELKKEHRFFGWQVRWATVTVAVVVIVLLMGGSTVAAANNSMPDEPLYAVKLATETVRLRLTPSALGKAELYVQLVDKRVAEITAMTHKDKPEKVEVAVKRLSAYLLAMDNLVAADVKEPTMLAAPAQPGVATPETPQPAPVAPSQTPQETKEAPRLAEKTPPGLASQGEGKDVKADKRAKLKAIVSSKAAANSEALRELLQKAPESVKPALRRAIQDADEGYEKALKALDKR